MRYRDHLFAVLVHGGILAVIALLLLTTSCENEKPKETDAVKLFFRQMQDSIDSAGAENIVVIQVNDSIGAGRDLQRQVLEEIHSRLHELKGSDILEYPQARLEQAFSRLGISPAEGISPEDVKSLARDLGAGALLYASIESKTPDVHFKVYSGETGAIIFASTLSGWVLPVTRAQEPPIDLTGGTAGVGEAESSGREAPQRLNGG